MMSSVVYDDWSKPEQSSNHPIYKKSSTLRWFKMIDFLPDISNEIVNFKTRKHVVGFEALLLTTCSKSIIVSISLKC